MDLYQSPQQRNKKWIPDANLSGLIPISNKNKANTWMLYAISNVVLEPRQVLKCKNNAPFSNWKFPSKIQMKYYEMEFEKSRTYGPGF